MSSILTLYYLILLVINLHKDESEEESDWQLWFDIFGPIIGIGLVNIASIVLEII